MIFQTPEDRDFYESRIKYLHDEEARLIAARQEGREEGREEGMEKGMEKGALIGKIQILQELVGTSVSDASDWLQGDVKALSDTLADLQDQLRSRGS